MVDQWMIFRYGLAMLIVGCMMAAGAQAQAEEKLFLTFEGNGEPGASQEEPGNDPRMIRHNAVEIVTDPVHAAEGSGSAYFGDASAPNTLELMDTKRLGLQFTLAAMVDSRGNRSLTRLFSSYVGKGKLTEGQLLFDFDSSGAALPGLRLVIGGETVLSDAVAFTDGQYHHLAATYDDGEVALYFDGESVGMGEAGRGPVELTDNLRIGEDVGGRANEQLRGYVDDILIADRVLSADEIRTLSRRGVPGGDRAKAQPPATDQVEDGIPRELGSRLELFIDHYLIDAMDNVRLALNHPRNEGAVLSFDESWDGPFSGYCTVIHDGDRYRLYYRGMEEGTSGDVTCYAESTDGVHWTKPSLGLFEVNGTKNNNVVLTGSAISHNFAPFLDTRSGVPDDERYKALGGKASTGLHAYVSADGIHWRPFHNGPVLTRGTRTGVFDSQNVAFWSEHEQQYVCYVRTRRAKGYRWVSRATSKDFIRWSELVEMVDPDGAPIEHLYTNQTHPYFRAPHIYIAIAARFVNHRVLTEEQGQAIHVDPNYIKNISDAVLMTSRGGHRYDRTFLESFIRPGIGLRNWTSRTNYPAPNVVQTGPDEMSIYVNENYAQPSAYLQRYSLRLDGFASVRAPYEGGEFITHPVTFDGQELVINFATSAAGSVRVEVQDADGQPIAGYTLKEAREQVGDEIERVVSWRHGTDVSALAGKPVRLRFVMKDADLYSLRFR